MKCYQCENPAMLKLDSIPLCLHCYHKYQQIINEKNAETERMINYLSDTMDHTIGFSTGSPRFLERKPTVINNTPLTVNSINIDRSVVGNVNTGYIDRLDLSMQSITQSNNNGAEEIKQFTEAILKENNLKREQKEEIVQQLDFLGQQLSVALDKRNTGAIKSVLYGIASLINFSSSLLTLWDPIKNLF